LLGPLEHNLGMRAMDVPRGLLDGRFNQHGEPAGETESCPPRWVPDLRARPPAELLDDLRLRLSRLADNHPSAQRGRPAPRDWDAPRQRDAPADLDAPRQLDPPRQRDARADQDALDDWLERGDWDAFAAERDISAPADQPAADDAQAAGLGGFTDAIRAASRLSDAFPDSPHVASLGDMSFFAHPGQTEPYRPWFMSSDPSTPWWAQDSGG
jgi:hypothetical protein